MDQEPLENGAVFSQMRSPHAAGLIAVGEGPLDQLATLAQKLFSLRSLQASPIGVDQFPARFDWNVAKACKDAWRLNGNCLHHAVHVTSPLVASSARRVLNSVSKLDGSNRYQRAGGESSRAQGQEASYPRHALRQQSGLVVSRATIRFASRSS